MIPNAGVFFLQFPQHEQNVPELVKPHQRKGENALLRITMSSASLQLNHLNLQPCSYHFILPFQNAFFTSKMDTRIES